MKQLVALALVIGLTTSALAAPAPQASPAATTKTTTKRKTTSTTAATNRRLDELEKTLAAQQQLLQQMQTSMQAKDAALQQAQEQAQQAQQQLQQTQATATQAQQKASEAQSLATAQQDTLTKVNGDLADVRSTLTNNAIGTQDEQKRVSALEGLMGRFRFNGDVRVRGESFLQDAPNFKDRNRARIRVRFGFDGKLNEDFIGSIALATGSLGDPTTTNESFTNFFDRKTIGLDKGYITYNPVAHHWLSLTGGKFPYQWQRTSVTGDPDLNPEGFDQKFSFDMKGKTLKNVTFQAMQLIYNENSTGTDSYTLGGQISTKLQFGPWTATPSFLALKWNNPDSLLTASAFAVQANKAGNTTIGTINVPGEGPGCAGGNAGGSVTLPAFPNCAFSPNGETNGIYTDSKGAAHFLSRYFYTDYILNNQFKTPWARLPINLLLEYEQNIDAASHPYDTTGTAIAGLGSQDKEYGLDFSVGQTKNKNDLQIGYAWLRQEQDSVLAAFAESDQRTPTNVLQNRVYGLWKVRSNTVASVTWWYGRTLNSNLQNNAASAAKSITTAGQTEPYLSRFQFDLIYSF
ncbi:MAG: putative porin [Acidobacteriales bacterium]|nr:putative porin [Terriglobales bacterium]